MVEGGEGELELIRQLENRGVQRALTMGSWVVRKAYSDDPIKIHSFVTMI